MQKLWDMAGVDGLEAAQSLFGEEVIYLSRFQSVETVLAGKECSVLRLCDRNFRIRYSGPLDQLITDQLITDQLITPLQHCIWIKQYSWLGTLTFPIEQLPAFIENATTRAPHRLTDLPNNQALPARFKDIPLLAWRHNIQGNPAVELHAAQTDLDRLSEQLKALRLVCMNSFTC
ncbi:MAG: hypothetical protein WA949_00455 [Phormidesmis sp.]